MKKLLILVFVLSTLVGCNSIPNKSVFEPLTAKELNGAMQQEPIFGEWYDSFVEDIGREIDDLSPSEIAKYSDITYRRLFKYMKYEYDLTWNNSRFDAKVKKQYKQRFGIDSIEGKEQWASYFTFYDLEREKRLKNLDHLVLEFTHDVYFENIEDLCIYKLIEIDGSTDRLYDEFNGDYNKLIEYVNKGGN
ncbi:MAG: hypothetical protein J6C57_01325 [Paludibacteraceae bacterium]|nr:hypothetical protein [Paludibacteraceae bacterium]